MPQQPYRIQVEERDYSGFVQPVVNETGAMVVDSFMGPTTPQLCQSENDVITYFGIPSASKWGTFEAISYANTAPVWVVRALGAGALYAGLDVKQSLIAGFGPRTGRDFDTFNPSTVKTNDIQTVGVGDGITKVFTSTLAHTPIVGGSYKLYSGTNLKDSTESSGVISGSDATGTLNLSNGALSLTFSGTAGTPAIFNSTIDLTLGVDLSIGGKPKACKITIDQTIFDNINLGSSASTSQSAIITAINTALGYTAATAIGSAYIRITGRYGSSSLGQIIIAPPTDTITYDSAVNLVFAISPFVLTQTVNATNPVGAVPLAGQNINVDYLYSQNLSTSLGFSVFAYSQYDDTFFQLAASITHITGQQYTLVLYQKVPNKGYSQLNSYTFSFLREKDSFGKSLYYKDVFKYDPYIKIYVNPGFNWNNPAVPSNSGTIVDFTGGNKGAPPQNSDFFAAWGNFQKATKYPAKILMDIYGGYANTLQNVLQNYQPYSMGISIIPPGNNAASAKIYRQSLGIDYDHMALYTNWATIVDPYNNSFAFVSQIGKIGVKWAQMQNVYDGLPPAGVDENQHGGQLDNSSFQVSDMEIVHYSEVDKQTLDQAQINPIILDPLYGPIIDGNRTLQVTLSDTSYIHTRRLYNLLEENIVTQVLRRQVFKLNDDVHRLQAKFLTEALLAPILAQNLLNEAVVVCDTTNNTGPVLDQRKFILDIYVKAAVSSEFVILRLTRLANAAVISQFIGG